jgi:hypothetical protein
LIHFLGSNPEHVPPLVIANYEFDFVPPNVTACLRNGSWPGAFEFADAIITVGAPSFAQFAKGGYPTAVSESA